MEYLPKLAGSGAQARLQDILKATIPEPLLLQVLDAAQRGNPNSVGFLTCALRTPFGERQLPIIIDIFLSNIHRSLIPQLADLAARVPSALDNAQRGLNSILGLQFIMAPKTNSFTVSIEGRLRHAQAIVMRIEPKVDDIMQWILFATRSSPSAYLPGRYPCYCDGEIIAAGSEIIEGLFSFDPVLGDALRSSVGLLDVMVQLWMMKNKDIDRFVWGEGEPPAPHHPDEYLVIPSENGCSVIKLAHILFGDSVIGPKLSKRWESYMGNVAIHRCHLDPWVLFVKILVSRISQVKELGQQGNITLFAFAANSTRLICVGNTFTPDLAMGSPGYIALYKAGYVGLIARTTHSISECCSRNDEGFVRHPDAPPGSVQCIDLLDGVPYNLLYAKILEIVTHAATSLDHFSEATSMELPGSKSYKLRVANHFRATITRAVCYPIWIGSVTQVLLSLSDVSREALNRLLAAFYDPEYGSLAPSNLDDWVGGVIQDSQRWEAEFQLFRKGKSLRRCENLVTTLSPDCLVASNTFKRCGGCRVAFYCSRRCQRQDWLRHKRVCSDLSQISSLLQNSDAIYLLHLRSWHAHLTLVQYKRGDGPAKHMRMSPSTIAILAAHRYPMVLLHIEADDYHWQDHGYSTFRSLNERFDAEYFQWAKSRPMVEDLGSSFGVGAMGMSRLVEGIFEFGEHRVFVSLKVLIVQRSDQVRDNEVDIIVLDQMFRFKQ